MSERNSGRNSEQVLGVIADTHIPDRSRRLHPGVLPAFQAAGVGAILHAGDISVPRVLAELGELAPVVAVRGNRDWFGFDELPLRRVVQANGARIGLTHGHGGWRPYVKDKVRYLLRGPQKFTVAAQRAGDFFPDGVDAVVFGHNHEPMNQWVDGRLVFNPGSACCPVLGDKPPSVGLLRVEGGRVNGEIVFLD